jgi:hypothetical protein
VGSNDNSIFFICGLHDCGERAVPLVYKTLAFALQLRNSAQNLNQVSQIVPDINLASIWPHYWRQPRLACWASVLPGRSRFLFSWSLGENQWEERYATGWADCIRALLGRLRSGHSVQSRTHKCSRLYFTAEVAQARLAMAKRSNVTTLNCSETNVSCHNQAATEGCPHPAVVVYPSEGQAS